MKYQSLCFSEEAEARAIEILLKFPPTDILHAVMMLYKNEPEISLRRAMAYAAIILSGRKNDNLVQPKN